MSEIIANSITKGNLAYISVKGLGSPVGTKDRDRCGVMPEYLKGAVCYRICGEIPVGRKPQDVEFLIRRSYQEDHTWQACKTDGCEGSDFEFDPKSSRACGLFKLWRGDGAHRDLMMKVTLD